MGKTNINVYQNLEAGKKFGHSKVPEHLRADEHHIDVLREGWKKYHINMSRVARMTGIKDYRLYHLLHKHYFATKREAELIDKAMVQLLWADKRYNFGEYYQRE